MSDSNADPGRLISSLESATRSYTFFLLATFTLLIDSALMYIHGYGLIYKVQHPDEIKISFGLELYLLFVAFSFVMSIIMIFVTPFVSELIFLFWQIKESVKNKIELLMLGRNENFSPESRPYDCVMLNELREKAVKSMDSYYLNLYKDENERKSKLYQKEANLRFVATAALVAGVINFVIFEKSSLLNACAEFLGSQAVVWLFLVMLAIVANNYLFLNHNIGWIKCPPLFQEIQDEERKKLRASLPIFRRNLHDDRD